MGGPRAHCTCDVPKGLLLMLTTRSARSLLGTFLYNQEIPHAVGLTLRSLIALLGPGRSLISSSGALSSAGGDAATGQRGDPVKSSILQTPRLQTGGAVPRMGACYPTPEAKFSTRARKMAPPLYAADGLVDAHALVGIYGAEESSGAQRSPILESGSSEESAAMERGTGAVPRRSPSQRQEPLWQRKGRNQRSLLRGKSG